MQDTSVYDHLQLTDMQKHTVAWKIVKNTPWYRRPLVLWSYFKSSVMLQVETKQKMSQTFWSFSRRHYRKSRAVKILVNLQLGLTLLTAFMQCRRSWDAPGKLLCSTPGYLYYHKIKFLSCNTGDCHQFKEKERQFLSQCFFVPIFKILSMVNLITAALCCGSIILAEKVSTPVVRLVEEVSALLCAGGQCWSKWLQDRT